MAPLWPACNQRDMYQFDVRAILADFEDQSTRLFAGDDEINVSIVEMREGTVKTKRRFTKSEEIAQFNRDARVPNTTTIILISQAYSWGELELSATTTRDLLSQLEISPSFWYLLKCFGSKHNVDDEFVGGCHDLVLSDEDDSFDLSYMVKHVEERKRPESYYSWSIRQTGIHHKYDAVQNDNTFIILNPNDGLSECIEGLRYAIDALDLHSLVLCKLTGRWSDYLIYLESVCGDISKQAVLAKGSQEFNNHGFEVRFSDSQCIRDRQDTLIDVSHVLDLNLGVFETLLASWGFSTGIEPFQNDSKRRSRSAASKIQNLSAKTKGYKCHVEKLLQKLHGSSVLVHNILNAQALSALQASSHMTAELTALAREDSLKAKQDTRTLKTITLLGFAYLPASFVATLLGTQYIKIHTEESSGNVSIDFDRELWVFLILTVLLVLITGGTWLLWERHNRRSDQASASKLVTEV